MMISMMVIMEIIIPQPTLPREVKEVGKADIVVVDGVRVVDGVHSLTLGDMVLITMTISLLKILSPI
jgi:hypothetical protein